MGFVSEHRGSPSPAVGTLRRLGLSPQAFAMNDLTKMNNLEPMWVMWVGARVGGVISGREGKYTRKSERWRWAQDDAGRSRLML